MAALTSTSANLSVTIAHAVSFLTRPLIPSHSAKSLLKLQLALDTELTALCAPSWVIEEPLRGSGHRRLTLSPDCLPPWTVYSACIKSGVQWFDWISSLGGREFELSIDPSCISIRHGKQDSTDRRFVVVWAVEAASSIVPTKPPSKVYRDSMITHGQRTHGQIHTKTVAQQLLENDLEDDDQLFAMIAHEISTPTWITPVRETFHTQSRSLSPLSATPSRSSSRSSNSSSGFSFNSAESSTSLTSASSTASPERKRVKQSRRERARQARVFVDMSKTDVTPYDGGKTTVLTGGVMLGGAPRKAIRPTATADSWRFARA
ncbi:hypothetical protein BDZ94DRAFT_1268215 [Collybia nuda]|uniref:Anti-proliferative protein domain-containing protein n=1 Tax=Collybia nuda TaxID=64659 RepID=A0A9P5XXB0_9AGAR|nr:hypothetical protein BDZ94DRAFT_1268215 [Collybia nuda]